MSLEKIIGYDEEKKNLIQMVGMLKDADSYRGKGIRIPRGIILYGEPGVGKSVMARSMAEEGISLVELRAADCCSDNTEAAVRGAFEKARSSTPSILLLDELDKIAGTSNIFFMRDNDNVKKMLIQEIDALSEEDTVIVVATCNDVRNLGPALTRPGRFDYVISIDLPDESTRKKIAEHYFSRIKLEKDFSLDEIARLTAGFSGAEIECLANETGIAVLENGLDRITMDEVVGVINQMTFNACGKSESKSYSELKKTAVHEAGHAVAALMLKPDEVYGASIITQGRTAGHVRMMSNEDRTVTVEDIKRDICITLAGRVAERIVFGDVTMGASEDIHMATKKLMDLITGQGVFGYRWLLYGDPSVEEVPSELADLFDGEMSRLGRQVASIIRENMGLLNRITSELLERRAISREGLMEICDKCTIEKAA